jgi:hypothetical protein
MRQRPLAIHVTQYAWLFPNVSCTIGSQIGLSRVQRETYLNTKHEYISSYALAMLEQERKRGPRAPRGKIQ